jgi:hypothetical protein
VSTAVAAQVNEATSSHVAATKLKKLGSLAIDDLPSCKCSGFNDIFLEADLLYMYCPGTMFVYPPRRGYRGKEYSLFLSGPGDRPDGRSSDHHRVYSVRHRGVIEVFSSDLKLSVSSWWGKNLLAERSPMILWKRYKIRLVLRPILRL